MLHLVSANAGFLLFISFGLQVVDWVNQHGYVIILIMQNMGWRLINKVSLIYEVSFLRLDTLSLKVWETCAEGLLDLRTVEVEAYAMGE